MYPERPLEAKSPNRAFGKAIGKVTIAEPEAGTVICPHCSIKPLGNF
jgi:hypothetical protein